MKRTEEVEILRRIEKLETERDRKIKFWNKVISGAIAGIIVGIILSWIF